LSALERLLVEEDGQDVVEYGLLIASIAVIVLMGVATFGALIQPWFARIANIITSTGA
jgi:Flp pilus assembly pilin Flp